MGQNTVVLRYQDGRILKGFTADFSPTKAIFHFTPTAAESKATEVRLDELKAIFFVKDPTGNPHYDETKDFDPSKPVIGRKIQVTFKDGETLVGTTHGYQYDRPGFFLIPADPLSNNDRCFVVTAATQNISFV
jgi:Family of unknown function (DUF6982)